jgi:hypothetical protein
MSRDPTADRRKAPGRTGLTTRSSTATCDLGRGAETRRVSGQVQAEAEMVAPLVGLRVGRRGGDSHCYVGGYHHQEPGSAIHDGRVPHCHHRHLEEGGVGWIQLGANGRFSATDLPNELFHPGPWRDGVTSANGTWTLDDRGGSVYLVPVDALRAEVSNIGLDIVERGHATHLCVTSGDPGVLCDFLLQRATN